MESQSYSFVFALLFMAVGIFLLAAPLLLKDKTHQPLKRCLVLFLLASVGSNSLPAINALLPGTEIYSLAILLPCYLAMPICLWLYVAGLTSSTKWQLTKADLRRFWPLAIAFVISIALITLPTETLEQIFGEDSSDLAWWPQTIVASVFFMMIFWLLFSAVYVVRILKALVQYRAKLKHHFANTEQRDLRWLSILVVTLALTWLISLMYSIPLLSMASIVLPVEVIAFMHTALVWVLAYFGIHQTPGFEGFYETASIISSRPQNPESSERAETEVDSTKYQKSGLGDAEMNRIASKINHAMQEDQLFLDSTLSLQGLSTELSISPNYLSQTLNEALNQSFFDYVNGWRIRYAAPKIAKAERSVLDIAMDAGFNARSSFYKAFKKELGQTPTEYRKRQLAMGS